MNNMIKSFFKRKTPTVAVGIQEIPAEVIHAEVDAMEEIFLNQVKKILDEKNSKKVDIEAKEINKSHLLHQLGFTNNNLIKDIKAKQAVNARIEAEIELNNKTVNLFQKYKTAYPTEKIIPFTEFEKVLKKYNLIYAPVQAYVKDVPEKNLLEIRRAKVTDSDHQMAPLYYISEVKVYSSYDKNITRTVANILDSDSELRFNNSKYYQKTEVLYYFTKHSRSRFHIEPSRVNISVHDEVFSAIFDLAISLNRTLDRKNIENTLISNEGFGIFISMDEFNKHIELVKDAILEERYPSMLILLDKAKGLFLTREKKHSKEISYYEYSSNDRIKKDLVEKYKLDAKLVEELRFTHKEISKEGLFIAAPKTHFDMSTLTKVENFGYYCTQIEKVKAVYTKDPIAFEFLQGNDKYREGFVRIISKWGTDDDQSYLDPIVIDERQN